MKPSFPLILKSTHGWVFIPVGGILFITAEDKYARLTYADGSTTMLFHSLADLERRLACGRRIGDLLFVRTHRTCIAAMHHAKAIPAGGGLQLEGNQVVPLRRGGPADLLRLMGTIRTSARAVRAALVLLVGNLMH